VDTSGSMDDDDVLNGLIEINEVIKNVGELLLIQIDTEIKGTQKFDKNNFKRFKRKGYGGTQMSPIVNYIEDNKVQCDVLIMISDMYIEDLTSTKEWVKFKKPVLWLSTSGEIPESPKKHKVLDIKNV
jgi:predicted metal-dependent peptidase